MHRYPDERDPDRDDNAIGEYLDYDQYNSARRNRASRPSSPQATPSYTPPQSRHPYESSERAERQDPRTQDQRGFGRSSERGSRQTADPGSRYGWVPGYRSHEELREHEYPVGYSIDDDPHMGRRLAPRVGLGRYAGVGPRGYRRTAAQITAAVNEALTRHEHVDARDIEVAADEEGHVALRGFVPERHMKWLAEEAAVGVRGVIDVHNDLRINRTPPDVHQSPTDNEVTRHRPLSANRPLRPGEEDELVDEVQPS